MNISEKYLKQVVQEELDKLKKGGRVDELFGWGKDWKKEAERDDLPDVEERIRTKSEQNEQNVGALLKLSQAILSHVLSQPHFQGVIAMAERKQLLEASKIIFKTNKEFITNEYRNFGEKGHGTFEQAFQYIRKHSAVLSNNPVFRTEMAKSNAEEAARLAHLKGKTRAATIGGGEQTARFTFAAGFEE